MCRGRSNAFDWLTKIGLCPEIKVTLHDEHQLCKTTSETELYLQRRARGFYIKNCAELYIYIYIYTNCVEFASGR